MVDLNVFLNGKKQEPKLHYRVYNTSMELIDLKKEEQQIRRTAYRMTRWIGSPTSLVAHTFVFLGCFAAVWFGYVAYDHMLLVLTTIVSLEAIYLSIFIQMTVNMTTEAVEDISEDVEEIQEDIDEIQENVEEISEDVDEMAEEEEEEDVQEEQRKQEQKNTLTQIHSDLRKLMEDINRLKNS